MADWLLTHHVALQSYLLLGCFGLIAVWESFSPRRPPATSVGLRWFNHFALTGVGYALARACLPFAAFGMAMLAAEQGWGLLNHVELPFALSVALGVVIMDLGGYIEHRLFHALPVLWSVHRIHHSDLDVDCGTAFRHHPAETLIAGTFDLALVAVIGIPPLGVFLALTLIGIANVWNHGNITVPVGWDRWLRRVVVTPDMHRIHHSVAVEESNRNYSMLLPWWDHLFSTYRDEPSLGHAQIALGILEARRASEVTLWKLIALPFRRDGSLPLRGQMARRLFP